MLLFGPLFDTDGHEFTLEIIRGEHDSIDGPVIERRGPCFDHARFTTADVERTWSRAIEYGVKPLSAPT